MVAKSLDSLPEWKSDFTFIGGSVASFFFLLIGVVLDKPFYQMCGFTIMILEALYFMHNSILLQMQEDRKQNGKN